MLPHATLLLPITLLSSLLGGALAAPTHDSSSHQRLERSAEHVTQARNTLVTSFILSEHDGCGNGGTTPSTTTQVPFGQACGVCTPTGGGSNLKSLSVLTLEPRCRFTVYTTPDCSDDGAGSGTGGCWSPGGGIAAYRVDCPWYPAELEPKACEDACDEDL